MAEDRKNSLKDAALAYHRLPKPGKLEVRATKPLANARDLSLAYSPGVAEACLAIKNQPEASRDMTARGNLVAVVSNGSAVLGLGNIGALASKPVMEGKAVLFKKFANIDCFDIELNETDPERLADIVCALEPTFGAINLEDIKAPDCFIVERLCRERMNIPVFHDDQHGTAIVVGAAATNALFLTDRAFDEIRVVSTGGGAAGIACLDMLLKLGVKRENVWLFDLDGLVHEGRAEDMTPQKAAYAQPGGMRSLDEIIEGADLFLGLSGPGVLTPGMAAKMTDRPIIFALANPVPEIDPEAAREAAPGAIIATGRSDFPNQVNNVLCFPFIFRGALDVGATEINDEMELACIAGIAELARATTSAEAAAVYQGEQLTFGPDYVIPKPFDPRLIGVVASAVAKAAMETGVATRPIEDLDDYKRHLDGSVFRSALLMRPVFDAAATAERRIVFAEGEDERVLRAANAMIEETTDAPILIGRPEVIEMRAERAGLKIRPGSHFEIVNPENDPRYRDYWTTYHGIMERRGVTPDIARAIMRTNSTAIAAVDHDRGDGGAVRAHDGPSDVRCHAAPLHDAVVRRPVVAVARVVLGVHDLEMAAGADLQARPLGPHLDHLGPADENGGVGGLLDHRVRGPEHALVLALGKDDPAFGRGSGVEDGTHQKGRSEHRAVEVALVVIEVLDRPGGHAGLHRRLGDGGGDDADEPRVEGLRNDIVRAESQLFALVDGGGLRTRRRAGEFRDAGDAGQFHLVVDLGRAHVERTPEDERKAQDIIDLIGEIRPSRGDDRPRRGLPRRLRVDLGHRVRKCEDDRSVGHLRGHPGRQNPGAGQT